MKKKLLFVYKYCNMGGVASVLKQRVRRMHAEYEFHCIFYNDAGTGRREWEKLGIRVHILGRRLLLELAEILSEEQYFAATVIDTPDALPVVQANVSCPVFYEVHTSLLHTLLASKGALSAAPRLLVPSDWLKELLTGSFQLEPGKISVAPNFVDPELFDSEGPAAATSKPTVLWVGKLDDNKNWRDALGVFEWLAKESDELRFVMATGGNQDPELLREFVAELLRRNLVRRLDHLHQIPYGDMPALYRAAARSGGILLSTSHSESFCMVVHEAWRCGLPVVSAAAGPVRTMAAHDRDSMLFEPYDVESAAALASRVLSDSELRQRLVAEGLRTVEHYSPEKAIATYRALLEEAVAEYEAPSLPQSS